MKADSQLHDPRYYLDELKLELRIQLIVESTQPITRESL